MHPPIFTDVSTAASITKNLDTLAKSIFEKVEGSEDDEFKREVVKLLDEVMQARNAMNRLIDENATLLKQLTDVSEALGKQLEIRNPDPMERWVGDAIYYFVGENGPYCNHCYDRDKRLSPLTNVINSSHGIRRDCETCGASYWEKQPS